MMRKHQLACDNGEVIFRMDMLMEQNVFSCRMCSLAERILLSYLMQYAQRPTGGRVLTSTALFVVAIPGSIGLVHTQHLKSNNGSNVVLACFLSYRK